MLVDGSVLVNYDNGTWIPLSLGSYCVDEIQIVKRNGRNRTKMRLIDALLVCENEYPAKGPKVY